MSDLERLIREVRGGRINRREFFARAAVLGLSAPAIGALLAACGDEGDGGGTSASPEALDTTLPAELYLYNWSDYMAPKAKKDFEKETGVKVVESFYDSNEELLAKLKAGATGYDIIVPSDYTVSIMIKTGLLMPLRMDLIPNVKNCEQAFIKPAFDPETDGNKYSVPYMFGTTGIGVRTDVYPTPVDSWGVLWDQANKGKIQMLDDEREVFGVAFSYLGMPINQTDPAAIDQAKQKLIEQKPLVKKYASSGLNRDLVSGSTPLIHCWDGDVGMALQNLSPDQIQYVMPKEGYVVWMDGMAIPKTAPSPYAAHLFLNFLLDTQHAADCANYVGYQSAVATTVPLVEDPNQNKLRPTAEQIAAGQFIEDLAEANTFYTEAWNEVKSE